MDHSAWAWIGLFGFVVVAFLVDFLFFEPKTGRASMRRSATWSVIWLALAFAFAGVLFVLEDSKSGSQFIAGYLLERSLSLDNLFVFAIVFGAFSVETAQRQRLLEIGIVIALLLRFAFIALGAELIHAFDWILYVFGAFLLYTGVQMARHRNDEDSFDPDTNAGVKLLRRIFPVSSEYDGHKLFTKENGKRLATPLLLVVAAIASADVIFAVDSIPAIFGVTTDTYIVFAANAFALLGLRALYGLLENAQERFVYLKLGLAMILVVIGLKMLFEWAWHMPVGVSLGLIVSLLAASIIASMVKTRGEVPPPRAA